MINTTTQTYKYNPTECIELERRMFNSMRRGKINKHFKRLIVECTGSQPDKIDYINAGSSRYYPVVKCTNNKVYMIEWSAYELKIVREGYTKGCLDELCNHMRKCWSMLGI